MRFQSRGTAARLSRALLISLALSVSACRARSDDQAVGAGRGNTGDTLRVDTRSVAAVQATLDSLRGVWERSVGAGDTATMATLLADSAVMVQPGSADWNAMAAVAAGAPFPPGTSIDISPMEIRVLGPEWAYEFGTSVVKYTPPGARDERTLHDTYLILFRKTADGWKVFREVASSKSLPAATPATHPPGQ